MQGYGSRQRAVLVSLIGAAAVVVSSCSALNIDDEPGRIVLPDTDAPITESAESSRSSVTTPVSGDDESSTSWSYERVIKAAPRADSSRFQIGSTAESGERSDVSGYHFSTEDRGIRCSTGTNGADALVCVSTEVYGAKRPSSQAGRCDWRDDYVVLADEEATEGACANNYPVLYRSRILSPGESLTVKRFACLADDDDLYCIDSVSGTGFAITSSGFKAIKADDRAPRSLLGLDSPPTSSTPNRSYSSPVVPTS